MIWHNLDAYQDTIPGLTELKRHVNILALSNGNFRLLLDLAKNQGVPWDGIFSSELFGSYKPNKKVYESAAYPFRQIRLSVSRWMSSCQCIT
jgi:HAD superfamily hydrolase (TIGR01493 family)